MKSTIKIDLGNDNGPVIKLHIIATDDVRDQLMKQFGQRLNYTSNLAFVEFSGTGFDFPVDSYQDMIISPITGGEEVRWINRLTQDQCRAIIPLAYDVLSNTDRTQVLASIGITTEHSVSTQLPSRYQVDDSICTEDIFDGQVVAVRFTIGKVYYDILNKLTGAIIRDVDSYEITEDHIKLPQAS